MEKLLVLIRKNIVPIIHHQDREGNNMTEKTPHQALVAGSKDIVVTIFPPLVYLMFTGDSSNAWIIFCLMFWAKFLINILEVKRSWK
jgi:hypothetical protein